MKDREHRQSAVDDDRFENLSKEVKSLLAYRSKTIKDLETKCNK